MKKHILKILILSALIIFPFSSRAQFSVLTGAAAGITDTEAVFSGSANPSGKTIFGYFRYAALTNPPIFCNDIYGSNMEATDDVNLGNGASSQSFIKPVSDLAPNTTYYFCAIASEQNKTSIGYGGVQQFTTRPCRTCAQATIQTKPALVVDSQSAYLNGFYNTNVKVKTWFEYRKIVPINQVPPPWSAAVNIETHTPPWSIPPPEPTSTLNSSSGPMKFLLAGLNPSFRYEFQAVIQDNDPVSQTYLNKIFGSAMAINLDSDTTVTSGEVSGGAEQGDDTDYSGNYGVGTGITGGGTTTGTGSTGGGVIGGGTAFSGAGTIGGGIFGPASGGVSGAVAPAPIVGSAATPFSDAIVRSREGIETVFTRQIMNYPGMAKLYGYQAGKDLKTFAENLAHTLAQIFGYVGPNGREIRVSYPDIAAYEFGLKDGKLAVYEYFAGRLTGIQIFTGTFKNAFGYEYYFSKR